jgi:DMSO/TMAO reductase YedYZ molybdopterin-dependent catalytic subunit
MKIIAIALFVASLTLPAGAQAPTATIQVTGDVKAPMTFTAEDLAKLPRNTVKTKGNGADVEYEGVWLYELLQRAGVPMGKELRGKALASYVLADAKDGYQVLYSVAELDPAMTEGDFLVADKVNGKPLSEEMGPFRVVSARDKRAARSIRMVTRLEVVQLRK